jgi:hypothetical protein
MPEPFLCCLGAEQQLPGGFMSTKRGKGIKKRVLQLSGGLIVSCILHWIAWPVFAVLGVELCLSQQFGPADSLRQHL